jgi:hypothetical protein
MVDTANRRKPGFLPLENAASGRLVRNDKGDAVWQWDGKREEENGSFHHLGLAIEGHDPPTTPVSPKKPKAKAAGYDPYQKIGGASPNPEKPKPSKRVDLRALSRHIALQRLVKENKTGVDEDDHDEES